MTFFFFYLKINDVFKYNNYYYYWPVYDFIGYLQVLLSPWIDIHRDNSKEYNYITLQIIYIQPQNNVHKFAKQCRYSIKGCTFVNTI